MDASVFHVISSTVSILHNTLTIGIALFLNSFNFWSVIPTGCTSNDKFSFKSTREAFSTWDGSKIYFLSMETWNTSWILSKSRGNSNRYATGPMLSKILNGPMYLGFNLSLFWNRINPFKGPLWEIPCLQLQIQPLFFRCLHSSFVDLRLS